MSDANYLGVDAGNSKTVALVSDAGGRVAGRGRSGNGDIYGAESPAAAVDAVLSAMRTALAQAGVGYVDGAAFRLAGVDWPEDEEFWRDRLRKLPELGAFTIANDGFAAIRCVEPDGVGIAIVCGTGPAVAARGPGGGRWSMGFWVQDHLGAGGLVDQALRAVYRNHLGLGPATVLTDRLLERFEQNDVERMLHFFTGRESIGRPSRRPSAAPLVTAAAAEGDAVAREIVTGQANRFADYGWVAARTVGFDVEADPLPVALAGSVLTGPPTLMADALAAAVVRRIPKARVRVATLPPAAGALLDALAESGVALTPTVVETLSHSL